ncbi:hypothetical protein SUGI_0002260 [Cryptomeria japonica]|uniref:uncharacterized protein LOC131068210 n=1 Tax=Cryptomeria japonica TaxID=3369 RepID=UPI002408EEE6|nr:uncharacterized protein LOC131068210 [Cryptomeria japonica]GLJ04736.1 hypothetical protein SUGI_0002260 [Cryptomeria japonica]
MDLFRAIFFILVILAIVSAESLHLEDSYNKHEEEMLQLLRPSIGHEKLEVNEVALERLASIEDPVAFVAVVGPYHGGKSFLLNVLLDSTHGFPVGSRPVPETRGIWIRIVPKSKLKGVDESQVILVDTEGFYGEGATRLYDAKVFAICTLLSSHLVYNTLRTLGDAQSVSSLADLSKQAQIFNLHNWLHTAGSEDETTPSIDLDVPLLLKTLDFPSLTWVVQGFDIDLEPSEAPMHHLQRYIAAQGHAGDRTLDTLFSHGISCYTLRTPADLNLLRERYGSKGLAAEEELIYTLHPKYLLDIENLRMAVFGNLTAKGGKKLTGKIVAKLLPLLVHYVNEDFPLSADRKLRDVLVDIIIDGAFAGGVRYFEKEMQSVFPTSDRLKLPTMDLSSAPKNLEALSTLASSALTIQEVNQLLADAENKAIDYCKQRCVGVPLVLTSSACQVSLGTKIERMKPLYREKNDYQVREVLMHLGEVLRQKAEKNLFDINLPVPQTEIQESCNKIIKDTLKKYESLVGPHQGSQQYHDACNQMHEQIMFKCDQVARINVGKITSILNSGKAAYQGAYTDAFSAAIENYTNAEQKIINGDKTFVDSESHSRPLPPTKLTDAHSISLKVAQEAYEETVKGGGLSWIGSGNELYDFHQFQCLQWSKQRYSESQVRNNAEITTFCEKLVSAISLCYRDLVSKITPFPDNDEIISEKANLISKQLMEAYRTMTKEYTLSGVEERQKELVQKIEDAHAHLIRKNTALMTAYCYDPLMDAYQELHMEDCERTFHNLFVSWSIWSLKCLWPGPLYTFGFKYVAYTAARKHLDKAQASARQESNLPSANHEIAKGVILSPATQKKVIQAWIEHDLDRHANVVLVNFSCIVSFIIVIFTSGLYIRKKTLSTSSQNAGSWSPGGTNFDWRQRDYRGYAGSSRLHKREY